MADLEKGAAQTKAEEVEISTISQEAPPSYDATPASTYNNDNSAAPPSYESLYGKILEAKANSDGNVDFAKSACVICCASIIPVVLMFAWWGLAIAALVMGAIHLDDCPAEKMIPVYLLVYGVVVTVKTLCTSGKYISNRNNEEGDEPSKFWQTERLLDCFLAIWFIVGNVYVYRTRGKYQSTDESASDYCDRDLYLFAFWLITVSYIIVAATIVLTCCCLCICCFCACFAKKDIK